MCLLVAVMDSNSPFAIVTHEYFKTIAVLWKICQQVFFHVKQNPAHAKSVVAVTIDRLANPTDWPFDGVSSADHAGRTIDGHDSSAFKDEPGLRFRNPQVANPMAVFHACGVNSGYRIHPRTSSFLGILPTDLTSPSTTTAGVPNTP